jgi:hypothetical protein
LLDRTDDGERLAWRLSLRGRDFLKSHPKVLWL